MDRDPDREEKRGIEKYREGEQGRERRRQMEKEKDRERLGHCVFLIICSARWCKVGCVYRKRPRYVC